MILSDEFQNSGPKEENYMETAVLLSDVKQVENTWKQEGDKLKRIPPTREVWSEIDQGVPSINHFWQSASLLLS